MSGYITYIIRADGNVVAYPSGSKDETTDLVMTIMLTHAEAGGTSATPALTCDDVFLGVIGEGKEVMAFILAAPEDEEFIDMFRQHVIADVELSDFSFENLSDHLTEQVH